MSSGCSRACRREVRSNLRGYLRDVVRFQPEAHVGLMRIQRRYNADATQMRRRCNADATQMQRGSGAFTALSSARRFKVLGRARGAAHAAVENRFPDDGPSSSAILIGHEKSSFGVEKGRKREACGRRKSFVDA